jgi:hypothetical protein
VGEASIVTRERSWFGDADRRRRSLRLTPHPRQGITTLSLWDEQECVGTIRLTHAEVPALISALAESLAAAATEPPTAPPLVVVPADATEADVARWMHARHAPGEPATQPPHQPSTSDVMVDALTRGWTALGHGARKLVDKTFPPIH